MSGPRLVATEFLGHRFIDPPYLPEGKDEYYLRNEQSAKPLDYWRKLKGDEIETLRRNENIAQDWGNVLVADGFSAQLIRNCEFYGLVRIGRLEPLCLEYHELVVPVGITNSRIIACDLGDNVSIHGVRHLAHYIIGDSAILLDIDEMHTSNHAKFGNGIIKDGEDESVRIRLDLINEAGGRSVIPFDGMIAADATLWATNRDQGDLMARLDEITQRHFDSRRGYYGTVGDGCVIKSCRVVKDVNIGPYAYIKGANKLKNLTIHSSDDEPTQVGEGVELVNGIIGYGSRIFYGCKAVRFVMGDNTNLKYGARLIHSFLGDNSTISCCEVLNNLVFPAHEQHHNNSFLIAALVMGQSNIGAGATIGSNHNSRAPDGEIHAGRGFWPGLCVNLKHNCRFASFLLLAKGSYESELNVPLPFSLVSNDASLDRLQIVPAYWWLYNMYALARNTWKFHARDKRKVKRQNIEFDCLAPDTCEEIFAGMELLEQWAAKAYLHDEGTSGEDKTRDELIALGRRLLTGPAENVEDLEILGEGIERSSRKTVILKAHAGYQAYRQMLHYYAVKSLLDYCRANPEANLTDMCRDLAGARQKRWVNLGGQLVQADDLERIKSRIISGRLDDWPAIHDAYGELWRKYPLDRQRHALATLLDLLAVKKLTAEIWSAALDQAVEIQRYVADQTHLSRKKDDENAFRRACYQSDREMQAVLGTAEDNGFVKQVRRETEEFVEYVQAVKKRIG